MWVVELPNGRFKFRERFTDPVTGKSRIVSVTMDRNSKQAENIARQLLAQKMQIRPKSMTLSELSELYLKEQEITVKPSTHTRNTFALHTICGILGDIQLEKLTAGYIRKAFLDTGKGPGTLNEHLKRLKAMLRWGYRNDFIQDIRFLDKLQDFSDVPHRQKIENKFLEREELNTLLDAMHNERWHDLTEFLALSGMRLGEASALLRSDVDLSSRIITVNKTYDFVNEIVTEPKTYTSNREIYLQDELLDLCRKIMFEDNILYMSDLFFSVDGNYIGYRAYNKYLKEISQKAIGRGITPHTLRHTHCSLLAEAGVDIDTISARLGHADSKVTRQIYLHITEKLKDKRNEQIKNIHIVSQ